MRIVRVYADVAGESHFEDVAVPMAAVDFAPPAPPVQLSAMTPAGQYGVLGAPPGWDGDWHPAPRRLLTVYLAGEWFETGAGAAGPGGAWAGCSVRTVD